MKACDISLDISIEMSLKNLRAKYGLDLVVMTKGCDGALLVSVRRHSFSARIQN